MMSQKKNAQKYMEEKERSLEIYPPHVPGVDSVRGLHSSSDVTESQVTNKASHLCPVYLISEAMLKV